MVGFFLEKGMLGEFFGRKGEVGGLGWWEFFGGHGAKRVKKPKWGEMGVRKVSKFWERGRMNPPFPLCLRLIYTNANLFPNEVDTLNFANL